MSTICSDQIMQICRIPQSEFTSKKEIAIRLRTAIEKGEIKPGTILPSVRDLARQLKISRSTAYRSMEELISQGYLCALPGRRIQVPNNLKASSIEIVETEEEELHRSPTHVLPHGDPVWSHVQRLIVRQLQTKTWQRVDQVVDGLDSLDRLTQAIGQYLRRARNVQYPMCQPVIFSGPRTRLDVLCRLLIDRQDLVGVEYDTAPEVISTLRAHGAVIHFLACDNEGLIVSQLPTEKHFFKFVYVFPSGQRCDAPVMSLERRRELVAWAAQTGSYVMEDDRGSETLRKRMFPCIQSIDDAESVIYLASSSNPIDSLLKLTSAVVPSQLIAPVCEVRSICELLSPTLQTVLSELIESGLYEQAISRMRDLALDTQERNAVATSTPLFAHNKFFSSSFVPGA